MPGERAMLCWQGSLFSSVEGMRGCMAQETVLPVGTLTQSYLFHTGELAEQVGSLLQARDHHLQYPLV